MSTDVNRVLTPADVRIRSGRGFSAGEPGLLRRLRAGTPGPLLRVVTDVALLLLAWIVGVSVAGIGGAWPAAFAAVVVVQSLASGVYRRKTRIGYLDEARFVVSTCLVGVGVVVSARALFAPVGVEASQTVRLAFLAAAALASGRIALNFWEEQARRREIGLVPTLIVGAGRIGQLTAQRLLRHPELGLKPVGYLDLDPMPDETGLGLPVLGASWDLDEVVAEHDIGQVIVTFSSAPSEVLLRLVARCEELGISVALVPRLFEKVRERLTIDHVGGLPLITSHPTDPHGWQFALKYALDRVVAFVLVVLAAPVLAVCAVAVWISLGRPILFRQRRVGYDGREFEMLKFRSLRPSSSFPDTPDDLPDDTAPGGFGNQARRTRVGAFLRDTSLDELPQLFNVLKGEMSLVGPRPERPEFVELFEPRIHRYDDRHRVRAGMTGWAQVNGLRGQTSLSDRIEWDNHYIENASFWLDLKIIGRTMLELVPRHSR
ncbi:MAG TPA: sugar transferase [Gaiellaceae bacterium]|jgi:exopolysaccharide biosynthesis polyprenyl glycosylphosphotransferase